MVRTKLTFSNGNVTTYQNTAVVKTQTHPSGISISSVQVNDVLICTTGKTTYTQIVTAKETE